MLWVILWKFVIIELTQVGLGEATTVDTERIWEQAVRRLVTRVNAAVFSFRQAMVSAEGKGHSPPSPSSLNVALEPLAEVDATGALSWSAQMRAHLLAAKAVPEVTAEPPARPIHATSVRAPHHKPRPIAFTPQKEGGAEAQADAAPKVVEGHDRYVWAMTRYLSVQRSGGEITVYSELDRGGRLKLTKVMAGGYLPVKKNTDKEKTSTALYKAMRAVERLPETDERHAFQHREQLFVFDATCDEDDAAEYVEGVCSSGLEDQLWKVTELTLPVSRDDAMKRIGKAISKGVFMQDVYAMRGPRPRAAAL